jgi:surface polysaccharide O-acyltransferase-like enzyme
MTIAKHQNIDWINDLRLVALYAVIVLHTSAILLAQYDKVPFVDWLTADFYNGLVRFAVPVFVMITGALSLHREYELGDFLKKRLMRIITPFLFWSLIYISYSLYNDEISFDANTWTNIKQVLHLLKYGSSYHLWYVYMLIGLYFIIPIISKFVRNATENEVLYFLIIWFGVMMLAQPYLARFNPQVDLHYFAGYIGYLVLGHYLAFKKLNYKNIRAWMAAVFLLTLLVIVVGTWLLYKNNSTMGTLFYEPVGPTVMLLSASIFVFFRFKTSRLSPRVKRMRDFIGSYNYGIYLAHALILYLLDRDYGDIAIHINYKLCAPIISIPLTALLCFTITFGLVWLISKLPFGRWISG